MSTPKSGDRSSVALSKTKVFIDANIWIGIYRNRNARKLGKMLSKMRTRIFVTKQVADEVRRNRVKAKAETVRDDLMKMQGANLLAIGVVNDVVGKDVKVELQKLTKKITEDVLDGIGAQMSRVVSGTDEISRMIEPFLAGAVAPATAEIDRARLRREFGNPPGKRSDTLGDQVSWEQLLSAAKGMEAVWIVSTDFDYGEEVKGRNYLNATLNSELRAAGVREAFLFSRLEKMISHFNETVTDVAVLTAKDSGELEKIAKQPDISGIVDRYLSSSILPASMRMAVNVSSAVPTYWGPNLPEPIRLALETEDRHRAAAERYFDGPLGQVLKQIAGISEGEKELSSVVPGEGKPKRKL